MDNWIKDDVRGDLFQAEYWIRPTVHIKYELNPDKTFKKFELKFNYGPKEWILTEYYDGTTNKTDYCTLTGDETRYARFVDAERKLVELMKDGKH